MQERSRFRFIHVVVGALAVVASTSVCGASADAGGWAVGSVDAIPDARSGETVEVGFTILQHGIHPADVDGDVGIEVTSPDGTSDVFAAVAGEAPGRYVASVTFSDPGIHEWSLRMGWFGSQELGTVVVADGTTPSDSIRASLPWTLAGVAVALATVAVASVRPRRRHPAST